MGKGRYIKAAERACARKARFETRAAAESFVAGRYRAYRCVVCGAYHLTSGRGDGKTPTLPSPKEEDAFTPKLGDLDWSAVLDPQPRKPKARPEPDPSPQSPLHEEPPGEGEPVARCLGECGKDGRVLLVFEGRLVKSRAVARELRAAIAAGVQVRVEGVPPTVVGLA